VLGVLKGDIMAVFKVFYSRQQFEKTFNATFNSFIPEKGKCGGHKGLSSY
jgi:hypothetical protein